MDCRKAETAEKLPGFHVPNSDGSLFMKLIGASRIRGQGFAVWAKCHAESCLAHRALEFQPFLPRGRVPKRCRAFGRHTIWINWTRGDHQSLAIRRQNCR